MPNEADKSGKVYIRLPGGYAPEDGKMPGDRVRAVVELELEEDGRACVVSVDGAKYEVAERKEEPAAEVEVTKEVKVTPESEGADPFYDKLMA